MIADRRFRGTCRGCGVRFDLFHYKGLHPDSRMGSHSCAKVEDRERLYALRNPYPLNVKEVALEPRGK